jgi:hypothetical protein
MACGTLGVDYRLLLLPAPTGDPFAELMLAAGVHPKVVSERLGHGGIGITLDTYSQVIPVLEGEAARVVDNVLGGSG